jgi:hypothetical protein
LFNCHVTQSAIPPPAKCSAPPRGSCVAEKRRIDAANAWSVSRNERAYCQRGDNGRKYGAIAALYIRKRRPATKQVSTITASGAPSA